MNTYCKYIGCLFFCLPTIVLARGSLGLPTTINGWATLLLIPIAFLSWKHSKFFSIITLSIFLSVIFRSFLPLSYAFGGAFSFVTLYVIISLPLVIYNRYKENLKLEEIAKSEVKWIRDEKGIHKIGSIVFYPNEHFEVTTSKKIGVNILYPTKKFIFAEEIENFHKY